MVRFIHRAENICKKQLIPLALICAMLLSVAPLPAAALEADNYDDRTLVKNWGFESGDLRDWTVLTSGWGIDEQGSPMGVVSARSYGECEMPTNQSGGYHLSGLHNGIPEAEGWEIRSSNFLLSGSGWISVKMGGQAAAVKVFLADGTQVGYYRQNRFRDVNYPYLSQGGSWDDMATYVMDLSEYLGKEMYVVLCDEVIGDSPANALFDDVITCYDAAPDPTFRFDTVMDGRAELGSASEVRIPWVMGYNLLRRYSEYDVKNGGFESGDLTGWTVLTEGFDASSAVVNARNYWDQELPYNQSGFYHLNGWNTGIPEAEGWAVRSSSFVLGGSGYISVKMGGNAAVTKVFLSDGTQIGYYRNFRFRDVSFPYIAQGGAWCDMATYVIDLSDYLGKELYLELHDEVITDGWANAFFDDVVTYYETAPEVSQRFDTVPDGHLPGEAAKLAQIPWVLVPKVNTQAARQIPNGDFETGDLTGWTIYGSGFPIRNGLPAANSDETYWDQELPYNKSGNYFLNGWALSSNEANTWRVRSTPFTLEGSGWISVKMGGHAAAVRVYRLDGTLVGDFDQSRFCDKEFPYISKGGSWCEMATYLLDLTPNIGEVLYIELCDDPIEGGWANAFFDDVVTYYPSKPVAKSQTVMDGHQPGEQARRVQIPTVVGVNNLYTPRNSSFEMGNLTGWTVLTNAIKTNTAVVAAEDYDLDVEENGAVTDKRRLPYNQVGNFILSGHDATWKEDDTWELQSSPFTLAGSGYISIKMGGHTAAFRVRTVADNKIIAYCRQRRFNDVNFPYISKGGSWRDMATYVMDLSPYLGQKLVIELMDEEMSESAGGWRDAYFDDIVTYYPQRPTTYADTVVDGYHVFTDNPKKIQIPWIYLNKYGGVVGRFPPDPDQAGTKNISGVIEPQNSLDLYQYFIKSQAMSNYASNTYRLNFTSVIYYDGNDSYTKVSGDYKNLPLNEGCYSVRYQLEQMGKTQTGSFDIIVSPPAPKNTIFNGSFETGTLAGWTPLTNGFNAGTAVTSDQTYWDQNLPYNQAGKYHLNGWNTGIGEGDSWAVRSSPFKLEGSGWISVRMGGKAAAVKVYRANDNTLVGYYRQERFNDIAFPNVARGSWADMGTYVMDLSAYIGQELYIELWDEVVSGGWAHAFFDDIVTYYATAPDWEEHSDTVTNSAGAEPATVSIPWRPAVNLAESVLNPAPANAQVKNGGFETGDLTGWTPLAPGFGDRNPVISARTYWDDNRNPPYNQAGNFHLNGWNTGVDESDSWAVRSSTFTLQGSGYISVRMGCNAAAVKVYTADGNKLIGYYKQTRFRDVDFGNVAVGSWADMGTYVMDLSDYIGQELYIELLDEGGGPWANAFFDEVVTYYKTAPDWGSKVDYVTNGTGWTPAIVGIPWQLAENLLIPDEPEPEEPAPEGAQIENGGFETGDLTGWKVLTAGLEADKVVVSDSTYWGENLPYNQAGKFHLNGVDLENGIAESDGWAIRSSTFKLQGSGWISVRMGGKAAAVKVYKANDNTLVGYYRQERFNDIAFPNVALGSWADMGTYVMDLSAYIGQELYIELHDEVVVGGWALAFFDEVVTYYKTAPKWETRSDIVTNGAGASPATVSIPWRPAVNLAESVLNPAPANAQVKNGGFETGDLTGWTPLAPGFGDRNPVISARTYWDDNRNPPYNQAGNFHLNGWNTGVDEPDSWAVRSSTFTLQGSGYISVRMGGNAAAVKVYTADGNKLIGYYKQTRFKDVDFGNVAVGSWADMGTYVMDLTDYIGQELYIELLDEGGGPWAHAFFDEVVTYYKTAPDWGSKVDYVTNGTGWTPAIVGIPWQLAENAVNGLAETGIATMVQLDETAMVPDDISKGEDAPEAEPEDAPEIESEDVPVAEPEDVPEVESEGAPEIEPEDVSVAEPEDAPEVEAGDAPEVEPGDAPEVEPEDVSEAEAEDAPEVEAEDAPEVEAEDVSEVESEDVPVVGSEGAPEVETENASEVETKNSPKTKSEDAPDVESDAKQESDTEQE